METVDHPTEFKVFRGLQRPLKLLIFEGRYIGWAVIVAALALIGFIVLYVVCGAVIAFPYLLLVLVVGGGKIFLAQRKGLYKKKEYKGTYMYVHTRDAFTKGKW